ncbi:MAG: Trp biosynthesis-associated membrane protein [Planctomycetaceae bacterium]
MEPSPTLDTSRPSPLRLASFVVVVLGAVLAGVGAVQTWVTVGIAHQSQLDSPTKGTDIWQGRVVLACAAVLLVCVIASRLVRDRARTVMGGLLVAAGAVCAGVAGAFLATAASTYSAIDDQGLVDAIAKATGATATQIREKACATLGCTTTVGVGPWLAVAGGALGLVGGILVLTWAARVGTGPSRDATEPGEVETSSPGSVG